MAVAKSVVIPLLVNRWPEVMGENLPAYNQIAGQGAPLNANCEVYIQPTERDPIARSLNTSLGKITRLLRYWPYPKWFQNTLPFGAGIPLRLQYLQVLSSAEGLGSWKLIEFGQRAATLIEPDSIVAYSDVGGYGVNNTATITAPLPAGVTNPDEIQIFFRAADGAPGAADERYQITPAEVSISSGIATITAARPLFVKPTVWDTPYVVTNPNLNERNEANYGAAGDFVAAVDVYRVYNDTTTQIEILDWNNTVLDTLDGVIVDSETGLFTFTHECLAQLQCYCRRPVRLRINYRAGLPLVNGYIDNELEDAIVRLANVLMPVELCPFCEITKNRWEQDRRPAIRDQVAILTQTAVNNTFGYVTYGSVYAYQTAVDRAIASGGKMTRRIFQW